LNVKAGVQLINDKPSKAAKQKDELLMLIRKTKFLNDILSAKERCHPCIV
jgi:hypothetical protein